ncbi:unnamed protein product [Moneuplotes crassus]|uniref:Partial AB-hydrolase lipase domain-containing protein n=1 Tax=Euplotes crassus TaxID=5936 RepID=A0AAD1UMD2_EUPCR|nr:unnamed protein product [Moneuplotes crassus]
MKLLVLALIAVLVRSQGGSYWSMDVQQRAEELGFEYEEYRVTTQDGYILTLMRIPSGPNSPPSSKPPILMIHPVFDSGESYTRLGAAYSPAFYLADNGKDVWLYNVRGNTFSREHVSLDPASDDEYWDFTMDTIRFDHMACVEFILETTGYTNLPALAISFGGATLGIALALEPEFFEQRISVAIFVSPALNMANTQSLLFSKLGMYPQVLQTMRNIGINVCRDDNRALSQITYMLGTIFPGFSQFIMGILIDQPDQSLEDQDGVNILLARTQFGLGIKALQHLLQSVRLNDLTYFDYGPEENNQIYGADIPPEIPLGNINVPIALMFGEEDNVITGPDQDWMRERLDANVVFDHVYEEFSHMSFLIGNRIEDYLEDVIEVSEAFISSTD